MLTEQVIMAIGALSRRGMSIPALARRPGIWRITVRKHLDAARAAQRTGS